jgi:hypothetical protein
LTDFQFFVKSSQLDRREIAFAFNLVQKINDRATLIAAPTSLTLFLILFVAAKPPPSHVFEQVALAAAEESGEYNLTKR